MWRKTSAIVLGLLVFWIFVFLRVRVMIDLLGALQGQASFLCSEVLGLVISLLQAFLVGFSVAWLVKEQGWFWGLLGYLIGVGTGIVVVGYGTRGTIRLEIDLSGVKGSILWVLLGFLLMVSVPALGGALGERVAKRRVGQRR